MPRAYVSGATGFIGSHLVMELLARGWDVTCPIRNVAKTDELCRLGVATTSTSLCDRAALAADLQGIDAVFHLAGATSALTEADFCAANELTAQAIAGACAHQASPPPLVLVSSVAAAGPVARRGVRSEAESERPISAYGRSKLAGERSAANFAGHVPLTILRPGVVFGPRDRASLSIFSSIRTSGVHVYPRWRTPPLSVIYVHDLVHAMLTAAERGERVPADAAQARTGTGVYFVCRSEYPTYHEFGQLAARALGRKWCIPLPLTPPIPLIVGSVGEGLARLRGKPSLVNRDKMREATAPSWACSPAKAERDLELSPRLPLLEQMRETVAWYRQAGWL